MEEVIAQKTAADAAVSGKKQQRVAELKRRDREYKKLQADLEQEKRKFEDANLRYQKDIGDMQESLYEEQQQKQSLLMELEAKQAEIELLQIKLQHVQADTNSVDSTDGLLNNGDGGLSFFNPFRDIFTRSKFVWLRLIVM